MANTRAGLQLGFAGSPPFAAHILHALVATGNAPKLVLTQPDRPSGRGKRLTPSAVRVAASEAGIDVLTPANLRSHNAQEDIPEEIGERMSAARLDALVVVAYGLILPSSLLNLPRYGCINVHASLLPRWRGAAPIERAMLAGDERTGITIMAMDEGLDTGPTYLAAETPILPADTGDTLRARLADLGGELLTQVLTKLADLPAQRPVPQDPAGACYAAKLKPAEARIDWAEPAVDLARKVRAFNSRMPAFAYLGEHRIRILLADAMPEGPAKAAPGTILNADRSGLSVATGAGQLVITELAMPRGKGKPMSVADALNGNADLLAAGRRFDG
jgi:methionyl-tRNA formyltransferase